MFKSIGNRVNDSIKIILVMQVLMWRPAWSYANSEAEAFVAATHVGAKRLAKENVSQQLGETLRGLSEALAQLEQLQKDLETTKGDLQSEIRNLARLYAEAVANPDSFSEEFLIHLVKKISHRYTRVLINESKAQDSIIEVLDMRGHYEGVVSSFLERLDSACTVGWLGEAGREDAPKFSISSPSFSVQFNIPILGGDVRETAHSNHAIVENGMDPQEASALGALTYSGVVIGTTKVMTGKWLLGQVSAAKVSAIYATAATVFAAMVAIAILVGHEAEIRESQKIVNLQKSIWQNRAQPKDVSRYFKAFCDEVRLEFADMNGLLASVRNQPQVATEHIEEMFLQAKLAVEPLFKAISQRQKREEQIRKDLEAGPQESMKSAEEKNREYAKRMQESPEFKSFTEVSEKITISDLARYVKWSLASGYLKIVLGEAEMQRQYTALRSESSREERRQQHRFIRKVLAWKQQSMRDLAWLKATDFDQFRVIHELMRKLDRTLIQYVSKFATTEKIEQGDLNDFYKEMGDWLSELDRAGANFPDSRLLKKIQENAMNLRDLSK